MTIDGREWQPQHIVGERQTPSGLEYEISVQYTLLLPRAAVNNKVCTEVQRGAAGGDHCTKWSSQLGSSLQRRQ